MTTIIESAAIGDLEDVVAQLDQGIDINHLSDIKNTPLHIAAATGKLNVVIELLKRTAVVDSGNVIGYSALQLAIIYGHTAVVDELLRHGACFRFQDCHGNSAFHLAAKYQRADIAAILAEKGYATAIYPNNNGDSPLHLAARRDNSAIVYSFLQRNRNPEQLTYFLLQQNQQGYTALHEAAIHGHVTVADTLLQAASSARIDQGSDQVINYSGPRLSYMPRGGYVTALDEFLTKTSGRNPDVTYNALDLALKHRQYPVVALLRSHGAQWSPVSKFILNKDTSAFTSLLLFDGVDTSNLPLEPDHSFVSIIHEMEDMKKIKVTPQTSLWNVITNAANHGNYLTAISLGQFNMITMETTKYHYFKNDVHNALKNVASYWQSCHILAQLIMQMTGEEIFSNTPMVEHICQYLTSDDRRNLQQAVIPIKETCNKQ